MRCAVLGHPVAHSLSPALHAAAHRVLDLPWEYGVVDVDEAGLAAFVRSRDTTWRGLSLTMPLKRAVLALPAPHLTRVDGSAARAGAANTLVRAPHAPGWTAWNTDVGGAAAALAERGLTGVRRAVVLGGGATAASVLLALAGAGLEQATVLVRDPARASETLRVVRAHDRAPQVVALPLGTAAEWIGPVDLVVSTVPAAAQEPLLPVVERAAAVFEVVYDPWPTPVAARALAAGARLVGGLDLLVHQAVLQVGVMSAPERGGDPGLAGPLTARLVAAMREAGENALAARAAG